MVTGMPVAGTRDYNSVAVQPGIVGSGLQGERHFSPLREGCGTTKLDTAPVDDHRVRRKGKAGLARFHGDLPIHQ